MLKSFPSWVEDINLHALHFLAKQEVHLIGCNIYSIDPPCLFKYRIIEFKMTAIYCVKCRSITNTKQEKERLLQMDGIGYLVYVLPAIQKKVCLLIVSGKFMKRLPMNKRRLNLIR